MAPNPQRSSFYSRFRFNENEANPMPALIFLEPDSDSETEVLEIVQLLAEQPQRAPAPTPVPHVWINLGEGMELLHGILPVEYENYFVAEVRALNGVGEIPANLTPPTSLSRPEADRLLLNMLTEGFLFRGQPLTEEQVDQVYDDFVGSFRDPTGEGQSYEEPSTGLGPDATVHWRRIDETHSETRIEIRNPQDLHG